MALSHVAALATIAALTILAATQASAQGVVPDQVPLLPCTEEYLLVSAGPLTVTRDGGCRVPEVFAAGRPLPPACPKILVAVPVGPLTVYYAPCTDIWIE